MSGVATKIKDMTWGKGEVALYKLDPPLKDYEEGAKSHEYVVVSSVVAMFSGPETYIFGCDENGSEDSVDWTELPGSFRGDLDHVAALRGAGYEDVR